MKIRGIVKRIEMDGWRMVRQAGIPQRICRPKRSRALCGKQAWKTNSLLSVL
jgi:predicted RNA binding protein YcfA (HicA-like mRNA interferase family)